MNEHQIIDTKFQEIDKEEPIYYTLDNIAEKLNISITKVNHFIFKFSKNDNNFFERTDKISQTDYEKLELALDLLENGMNYDEIVAYFKNNIRNLINKDTGEIKEDLSKTDSQVIAKSVTIEINKRMDILESAITSTITNNVTESFKEEAKKIAQLSLEAMEQTKNIMVNGMDAMNNKVETLEKKIESKDKELERLYSKDTERMRNKLDEKQKEIEELEKKLELEKNKSIIDRIFKR
jgi:exonuclease VII large subunit